MCRWPFASASLVLIAIDLLRTHGLARCLLWIFNAFALVVVPSAVIDAVFFRSYEIPAFNIVRYNVLDADTSSTLYGREPLMYYVRNLLINFNIVLPLAVIGVFVIMWQRRWHELHVIAPMLIWFAIMFPQVISHLFSRNIIRLFVFINFLATQRRTIFIHRLSIYLFIRIILFVFIISKRSFCKYNDRIVDCLLRLRINESINGFSRQLWSAVANVDKSQSNDK